MVYFVRIPNGCIKIGSSEDFRVRLGSLRSKYGRLTRMLALIPGSTPEERALHRRFDAVRIGATEVFSPSRELLAFIDGLPEPVIRCMDELPRNPPPPRRRFPPGERAFVSLTGASRSIGQGRGSLVSLAATLGIELFEASRETFMRKADFDRLKERVESFRKHRARKPRGARPIT